jgi:hypothetical protein
MKQSEIKYNEIYEDTNRKQRQITRIFLDDNAWTQNKSLWLVDYVDIINDNFKGGHTILLKTFAKWALEKIKSEKQIITKDNLEVDQTDLTPFEPDIEKALKQGT